MSSGKLDQSLDEILTSQRRTAGRRRSTRRPAGRPAAAAAPVGGIQKAGKAVRGNAAKPAPNKGVGGIGSKIMVSNLVSYYDPIRRPVQGAAADPSQPKDVSEPQIKVCYR